MHPHHGLHGGWQCPTVWLVLFPLLTSLTPPPPSAAKDIVVEMVVPARTCQAGKSIVIQLDAPEHEALRFVEKARAELATSVLKGNRTLRPWMGKGVEWLDKVFGTSLSETYGQFVDRKPPDLVLTCSLTGYSYTTGTKFSDGSYEMFVKLRANYALLALGQTLDAGELTESSSNSRAGWGPINIVDPGVSRQSLDDAVVRSVVRRVALSVADITIPTRMRLMDKGGLDKSIDLARSGQWLSYVEAISRLPTKPSDKEFEGDRRYNLGAAFEAQAYSHFLSDPLKCQEYIDLARDNLKQACQLDPKEEEYEEALLRLDLTEQLLRKAIDCRRQIAAMPPPPPPPPAMSNASIIEMVQAKLSTEVILNAIKTEPVVDFDMGVAGLKKLAAAKVPDAIILAMQARAARK